MMWLGNLGEVTNNYFKLGMYMLHGTTMTWLQGWCNVRKIWWMKMQMLNKKSQIHKKKKKKIRNCFVKLTKLTLTHVGSTNYPLFISTVVHKHPSFHYPILLYSPMHHCSLHMRDFLPVDDIIAPVWFLLLENWSISMQSDRLNATRVCVTFSIKTTRNYTG